jgi:phospholipase/carboxylesterase
MPTEFASDFIYRFVPGTKPATLLTLHGTGGDENDLLPVARAIAPGASILSPRGKVLENGAARFFARTAPGVFDENEIRARAAELADWIRAAAAEYKLDPKKIFAFGYSNGANIASSILLLRPGTIAGAALLRPRAVLAPGELPDLKGAPVLIAAGQVDTMTPEGDAEKLARLLAQAGAQVDVAMQKAGHDLTPQDFAVAKRWLDSVLSREAASGTPDGGAGRMSGSA